MVPNQSPAAGGDAPTSASLLQKAVAHDGSAWDRLVGLYGPLVRSWCRKQLLAREIDEIDDVFNDVFLAVWRNLHTFERLKQGSFRCWLRTITRNKINDYFRSGRDRTKPVGGSSANEWFSRVPDASDEGSVSDDDASDQATLVRCALELIKPRFQEHSWQAFWLTTVENCDATEAAKKLGMAPTAVRSAKLRILRQLRSELEDTGDFDWAK